MTRWVGVIVALSLASAACQRKSEIAPKPVTLPRGVRVTEREILLDGVKLAELGTLSEQATQGVNERFKRRGPNDLEIVPLSAALARRANPSATGRLRIELAATTPYRVLSEVMYSAGQSGVSAVSLYIAASGARAALEVDTQLPTAVSTKPPVVFTLVAAGIKVKHDARNVAPGCQSFGPGTAVPKRAGYDWPALAACYQALSALEPSVSARDGVLAPNADVPALDVLRAASVARCGEPSCAGRRLGAPFVDQLVFGLAALVTEP